MHENFSPEEQKLLRLSDEDNKRIINAYVKGQPFTFEFIKSLHVDESKKICRDYNQTLQELEYHKKQAESFSDYIQTMKTWY